MLSPLVSWILSSSSASSDADYENDNDDEENYHFRSERDDSPSTTCVDATIPNASPAVTMDFPEANDTGTNTPPKRHRIIDYSGIMGQSQRLWTKQDEIELLKGCFDYIRQRRWATTTSLQNDVALFYDHIRPKLMVAFNKNQLVEKLRRSKRKHKTVLDKINSGKQVSFKNPQEKVIFEISQKIWGKNRDLNAFDDDDIDESSPNPDTHDFANIKVKKEIDGDEMENKALRPQKGPRLNDGFGKY